MSAKRIARLKWLKRQARERILLLDGAWGVMIQGYGLSEEKQFSIAENTCIDRINQQQNKSASQTRAAGTSLIPRFPCLAS